LTPTMLCKQPLMHNAESELPRKLPTKHVGDLDQAVYRVYAATGEPGSC
jgi:hypothetical protein